jgi:hypothetical protein
VGRDQRAALPQAAHSCDGAGQSLVIRRQDTFEDNQTRDNAIYTGIA